MHTGSKTTHQLDFATTGTFHKKNSSFLFLTDSTKFKTAIVTIPLSYRCLFKHLQELYRLTVPDLRPAWRSTDPLSGLTTPRFPQRDKNLSDVSVVQKLVKAVTWQPAGCSATCRPSKWKRCPLTCNTSGMIQYLSYHQDNQ